MRHPIYTRPDPSRMGDIDFVLGYAVNFDGYAYQAKVKSEKGLKLRIKTA